MRLIILPLGWTVLVDVVAWLAIHLGVSWLFTQFSDKIFNPEGPVFRIRSWEKISFYEKGCRIKLWKGRLPDAAAWFAGGFPKRSLHSRNTSYLDRFVRETCRGEATHWTTASFSLLFFLWNPLWVGFMMVGYAVALNLPCILTQRYNRIRLTLLLKKNDRGG